MKLNPLALSLLLALAPISGCNVSSPRGGGMASETGFRMVVPRELVLQQGAVQTVNVTADRGDQFKQDIKLNVRAERGISVDPGDVTIKASANPTAQIKVSAGRDAALGDYRVTVNATPSAGESTMTDFRVKVVGP